MEFKAESEFIGTKQPLTPQEIDCVNTSIAVEMQTLDSTTSISLTHMEIVRNLPELIEQLKKMNEEMKKNSKTYERLLRGQSGSGSPTRKSLQASNTNEYYDHDLRDSTSEYIQEDYYYEPQEQSGGRRTSIIFSSSSKRQHSLKRMPRPSISIPTFVRSVDYNVLWVSGECGISLRNFSLDKIGAQIAVLQQTEGITTGISNARLGDQLISVNDENVEFMHFKEIVHRLKSTRRPIQLGFRTNPSVKTSPIASAPRQHATFMEENHENFRGSLYDLNVASMRSDMNSMMMSSTQSVNSPDLFRQSSASGHSSTSTLSDEVELWCKEQEEMHSDIVMLITETVMRCEKLQQETRDHVQNLMHFTVPDVKPSLTVADSYINSINTIQQENRPDVMPAFTVADSYINSVNTISNDTQCA
jgi:hypothetical protein